MKFSIVIPTRGNSKSLFRLIFFLSRQDYDFAEFEVIIVSQKRILFFENNLQHNSISQLNLKYIKSNSKSVSKLRNIGVSNTKNRHIICLDDDVEPSPFLLKGYAVFWKKNIGEKKVVLVGGGIKPVFQNKYRPSLDEMLIVRDHGWCFASQETLQMDKKLVFGETLISANTSFIKGDVIFNQKMGLKINEKALLGAEDVELSYRLMWLGKEIILLSDARVCVLHRVSKERLTMKYLRRRYFLVGIEMYELEQQLFAAGLPIRSFFLKWFHFADLFSSLKRLMLIGYLFRFLSGPKYDLFFSPNYFLGKYFFYD